MISLRTMTGLMIAVSCCVPAGCKHQEAPAPPPPVVTVAKPVRQEVINYEYFTGRTDAIASVDLRARVQGFLKSIHFKDGTEVKKGALLFVIDPAPFKAKLDQAEASLARTKAVGENAEFHYKRLKEAYDKKVATSLELFNALYIRDETVANVASAKAVVEQARIDLGYTKVYAPIDGRMSRHLVDIGNLVGVSEPTLLATIISQDPIYAYFDISESDPLVHIELQRLRRDDSKPRERNKLSADLGLTGEAGYPHVGHLDYCSNRVDPGTGTFRIRGVWPNGQRVMLPGMFARIRLPIGKEKHALLVPSVAVAADQAGSYLLVVDSRNVVRHQRVKLGETVKGLRVVREGLKPDDWVVVNGLQRARVGSMVTPQRQSPPATKPAKGKPTPPSAMTKPAK